VVILKRAGEDDKDVHAAAEREDVVDRSEGREFG